MADPRPLTRNELAKFLPDQRSIRAFEKLFDLIPNEFILIDGRLVILENPPTTNVDTDVTLSTDYYAIIVAADGLVLTLPKCSEGIKGRIWTISLFIIGSVEILTQDGDSFPTLDESEETSIILNRRGSTIDLRCVSTNQWSFV
tara:strand:- start:32081 stop:32512 length:432 start_codon:yes stop_codon:yes gene_type:complete